MSTKRRAPAPIKTTKTKKAAKKKLTVQEPTQYAKKLADKEKIPAPKKKAKKITLKEYNKKVRKGNKEFQKASPSRKRILIAKDVIKHIQSGKIEPKATIYYKAVDPEFSNYEDVFDEFQEYKKQCELPKGIDAQQILKKPTVECQACALGSMFISDIIRNDAFSVKKMDGERDSAAKRLSKHFSQLQLDMIEMAFEGRNIGDNDKLSDRNSLFGGWTDLGAKCVAFYNQFPKDRFGQDSNATKRLVAIMNNIIENKGEFKP